MAAKTKVIEDFGEKIGGARKDFWCKGIQVEDLVDMNEREAVKYVKKDYVWKKPDYTALIESGIPSDVVYFIKKVRDNVNTAPDVDTFWAANDKEKVRKYLEKYVNTVQALKEIVESVRTEQDCLNAYDKFLEATGLTERDFYSHPAVSIRTRSVLRISTTSEFKWYISKEAKRKQFGVDKEHKIPTGYKVNKVLNTGGREGWIPNTYYFSRGYIIIERNFPTKEEAVKAAQAYAQKAESSKRQKDSKKKFVPAQLQHINRTGTDYTNGHDVTGEDYLEIFGFRGGEFGNWLNTDDRQASLNMGFEALKDLADALHISDKDISLGGQLAIAFGARGKGQALAHYEPLRKVINLTKLRGAGSLAHEWWHAFDDYLGSTFANVKYLSDAAGKWEPMQQLLDVIKYKERTVSVEEAKGKKEEILKRRQKEAEVFLTAVLGKDFPGTDASDEDKAEYERLKADFFKGVSGSADAINHLKRKVSSSGAGIPENSLAYLATNEILLRKAYYDMENATVMTERVKTDYYEHSKKFSSACSKDGDYWDSNVEMTARAFSCYVMDRLTNQSDYLVGHAESCKARFTQEDGSVKTYYAFPRGEERERINQAFDRIFEEVREAGLFTYQEHPEPLMKQEPKFEKADNVTPFPAVELREEASGQLAMFA